MEAQPSLLFRRPFLACFMVGFVKLQLFIVVLYAFGALVMGEFIVVVAAQVILAAAFAWFDSAVLDNILQPPQKS